MQVLNTPFVRCWVKDRYLYNGDKTKTGLTECYIFAATCLFNRPILFSVHLKTGAVFSRLPIEAFLHEYLPNHDNFELEQLEPWACLGKEHVLIEHTYLKDYEIMVRAPEFQGHGIYLFTIDAVGGGFSEDPGQHKCFHIIAMENGHFAAMPNNFCLFHDKHFTESGDVPKYRRNTTFFRGSN